MPQAFVIEDSALVAVGQENAFPWTERFLHGEAVTQRPPPHVNLVSAEDGHSRVELHQVTQQRPAFQGAVGERRKALASIKVEVELGFNLPTAFKEAERCLNCDVQTVFADKPCTECDACVDICPTDCITFTHNGEEAGFAHATDGAGRQHRANAAGKRVGVRP